jgi:lanthanide-dependent methanol dehydrogenase
MNYLSAARKNVLSRCRGVAKNYLGISVGALSIALGALSSVSASAQAAPPQTGAEWWTPGGTQQGTRYSGLAEITAANAGGLVEEFSYPTGVKNSHQGSPLVVGNTLYIVTPFPNNLISVDLTTHQQNWIYSGNAAQFSKGLTCCDVVNRGGAYGVVNGKGVVVYTLLDGHVVAVDASTGKEVWKVKVADPWTGETLNTAPIIANDKVIFGSSGSEMGVRGSVRALNLANGKLAWQAYATGPDVDVLIDSSTKPWFQKDKGTNLGMSSWPGSLWKQGGGTSWAWITHDPGSNTVFYGTSQPGTFNPTMRQLSPGTPGENKWGSAIFARDVDTGKAKWVYQLVPWDNWDYDAVNESTVVDLPLGPGGATRQVVVHLNKNGFAYILDRGTGELISANPFSDANWATGIDLKTGYPNVVASKLTREGERTDYICPSAFGAKDWEYSAFSPATGLFYFGAHNMCMTYEPLRVNFIAGTPFTGADLGIVPHKDAQGAIEPNLGEFVAFDPVKGQRKWTIKENAPVFGGALVTAGNVVFYGTLDKKFKAVDANTGAVLYSTTLECGVTSAPITFTGNDGKQRIAITTGLGRLNGAFSGSGPCPAISGGESSSTTSPQTKMAKAYAGDAAEGEGEKAAPTHGVVAHSVGAAAAAGPTTGVVHVFRLP